MKTRILLVVVVVLFSLSLAALSVQAQGEVPSTCNIYGDPATRVIVLADAFTDQMVQADPIQRMVVEGIAYYTVSQPADGWVAGPCLGILNSVCEVDGGVQLEVTVRVDEMWEYEPLLATPCNVLIEGRVELVEEHHIWILRSPEGMANILPRARLRKGWIESV